MWHMLDGAQCKWCGVAFNPFVEPLDCHTDDCQYWEGLEWLMEYDRQLFSQHPGVESIVRYVSPYDFPMICYADNVHICEGMGMRVTQIAPGVRERQLIESCSCDLSEYAILSV